MNQAESSIPAPPASSGTSGGPFDRFDRTRLLACLTLLGLTIWLYSPAAKFAFLSWDDHAYITGNVHVRSGLTTQNVIWAFTSTNTNWHPLTWLSHMLDCQFFGLSPAGHHYMNVLLHGINVLLLFYLLQQATGYVWRSLLVSGLFACHPLNVESVAWIAERKNLLSTVFLFAAMGAYGWYAKRPGWKRYLAIVGAFAGSLMAKPMAVSLPFVLLLLDYWPLQRLHFSHKSCPEERVRQESLSRMWQLVIEKLPLFVISGICAGVAVHAQASGGAMAAGRTITVSVRVSNALVSYGQYIRKMFWPSGLSAFYPHPGNSLQVGEIVLSVLLLACTTLVVLTFHRRRYLVVGWLFFLGTLVPVIGIVQVGRQAMADRYAYVPLIGLFVIVVWVAADGARAIALRPAWLTITATFVLLALGYMTHITLAYWKDSISVFARARDVASRPDASIEANLGDALMSAGRLEDALRHFKLAQSIDPADATPYYNTGLILMQKGQTQEAAQQFQLAVQHSDSRVISVVALNNLGLSYLRLGDLEKAWKSYTAALQLDPLHHQAMIGRGLVLFEQKRYEQARNEFSRGLRIYPSPEGYFWSGKSLEAQGRSQQAIAAYREALRLDPEFAAARERMALLSHLQH